MVRCLYLNCIRTRAKHWIQESLLCVRTNSSCFSAFLLMYSINILGDECCMHHATRMPYSYNTHPPFPQSHPHHTLFIVLADPKSLHPQMQQQNSRQIETRSSQLYHAAIAPNSIARRPPCTLNALTALAPLDGAVADPLLVDELPPVEVGVDEPELVADALPDFELAAEEAAEAALAELLALADQLMI